MNQHIHILCLGNISIPPPAFVEPISAPLSTTLETVAPLVVPRRFSPLIHTPDRFLRLDENGIELPMGTTGHAIVRDLALDLDWLVAYPTDDALPHDQAMAAAAAVTVGGHADWRAPTVTEQFSLVRHDRFDPAADVELFPGTKSGRHWTSSPGPSDPSCAFYVFFDYGDVALDHRDDPGWVRAVRSVAPASAASQ